MSELTEAQSIAALAISKASQQEVNGHTFIVLQSDGQEQIESLEKFEPTPYRPKGTHSFSDLASFITFVKANPNKTPLVLCDTEASRFTAIFNAHGDVAGWGDWRAIYACPHSRDWLRWVGNNNKKMTQEDFARFIEDGSINITRPEAATMIEISRSLQAKKTVQFTESIRLSNGQSQIGYTEEIKGTASKGTLEIPETFQITIPVYKGDAAYEIQVRLRYRIEAARLQMWYELVRHDVVADDAIKLMAETLAKELATTVLNGTY